MRSVIIIGGGAAGMLSAIFAAKNGAKVMLLERNEKLGKKVYITGKGRCNLTNVAQGEDFLRQIARNPRFLYAAMANFDSADMMALMESLGVPVKVERGGRVFPVSDHASDVTAGLKRELNRLGVEIRYETRVHALRIADGVCKGVLTESGEALSADALIVCTGGLSYPSTGSTGDGLRFAEDAGHAVAEPRPSLVPIDTRESWPGMLAGLSLKNVVLRAWTVGKKKKVFFEEMGEMLFTHNGISGPIALSLSSRLPANLDGIQMEIDLKPALDMQALDARLLRDFKELSRKQIVHVMDGLAPHSLGQQILVLAGISPQTPVHSVTQAQRARIAELLKGLPLTPSGVHGFEEAIVTRGGVSVKEINPSTMASKRVRGLYFAGEVLDVDAMTGGFNLQIAFSTGALAGRSAALEEA